MIEKLPYIVSPVVASVLYMTGGVVYALATEGWMVIAGRFLSGFACTIGAVLQTSYIGEMGTRVDEFRKKRKKGRQLRTGLYIMYSFLVNFGYVITFVATSIMAQFPGVNPYRWPGWFVAAMGFVYGMVVLLTFTETRSFTLPKWKCSSLSGLKLFTALSSKWKIRLLIYILLVSCGYVAGSCYSLIYTLITPALSDQFGFSVKSVSYFLMGISIIFLATTFIQILLKLLRVDNRVFLIIALAVGLTGAVLMGDWQAIGHDPCSSASGVHPLNASNNSKESDTDMSGIFPSGVLSSASGLGSGMLEPAPFTPSGIENSTLASSFYQQRCEALSSSSHQCFWNPHSRITGEHCNTCEPACLSEQRSLNFYQFSIGASLVALCAPLGFVFVAVVTSGYTSVEHQGTLMSLVLGAGALGRVISPLWLVETYELSGKHTYISMAIFATCIAVVLLCLIPLYRQLAPRSRVQEEQYYVTAPFTAKEEKEEVLGDFIKYVHDQMEQSALSVTTFLPDSRTTLIRHTDPKLTDVLSEEPHVYNDALLVSFVIGEETLSAAADSPT